MTVTVYNGRILLYTLACAQKLKLVIYKNFYYGLFYLVLYPISLQLPWMASVVGGERKEGGLNNREVKIMPDIETTCVRTALISTSTATATTVSSSMPCEPCSSNYLQTVICNNILGSTNSVYLPYSPLLYSSPCTTYAPDLYAPQCTPYSTPFASPFTSSYSQAHVSHSTNPNTFYLKFIQGNIRMCQGCRNSLRSVDGKVPPPHLI